MNASSLIELNQALVKFERANYVERELDHRFVFAVGAPRSGTTLLTQVLTYGLRAGYICNLAARFWLAPVTGIQLAQAVLGDDIKPGFDSRYARTSHPSDIHEFGYFWKAHLGEPPYRRESVDFGSLRLTLQNIACQFAGPTVMKGIYPAYYPHQMRRILDGKVVFVNIERNPLDACVSILRARRSRFGDEHDWFAWKPFVDEFERLKRLGVVEQIVGQVKWFRQYYREVADLTIDLNTVCEAPNKVVGMVGRVCRRVPRNGLRFVRHSDDQRDLFRDAWERLQ
jgi:hypothetical protein